MFPRKTRFGKSDRLAGQINGRAAPQGHGMLRNPIFLLALILLAPAVSLADTARYTVITGGKNVGHLTAARELPALPGGVLRLEKGDTLTVQGSAGTIDWKYLD